MSPEVPLLLEGFLPYRLNVLAATVSEGLARVYSQRFGLDIPGWRVLATLGQFGAVTARAIGDHSHMHKTKVSRAVNDLERRGFVLRSPNPDDKREAFVCLSDAGRSVYREIIPLAQSYQEELLKSLSDSQLQALDQAIAALTEQAKSLQDAPESRKSPKP
jgi:DNA-binding MarR family transcriptional regulator